MHLVKFLSRPRRTKYKLNNHRNYIIQTKLHHKKKHFLCDVSHLQTYIV